MQNTAIKKNKLRVVFFSKELSNVPFILNQVKEINRFHDVLYLYSQRATKVNVDFQNKKINYPITNIKKGIKEWLEIHDFYMNFRNKLFSAQLEKEILLFNPDIIHIQFGYDALLFFDNCYSEDRRYIIQFRGYDASNKLVSKKYRRKISTILSLSNVYSILVCNSLLKNLKKYNISLFNDPLILYSNTDTGFFHRKTEPTNKTFTFIQISSFRKKKGHIYTLKAFRKLIDEFNPSIRIQLIFTGFDNQNDNCIAILNYVKKMNLGEYVIFLNWVDRNHAKKLLQGSHVAIQHSLTTFDNDQEGIPNFLMEAMSMELPVISTKHSGIPELVDEKAFGVLVDERDIDSYASAMEWMINNWRLAPENRKVILEKFSKEQHIYNLNSHYGKIISTTI